MKYYSTQLPSGPPFFLHVHGVHSSLRNFGKRLPFWLLRCCAERPRVMPAGFFIFCCFMFPTGCETGPTSLYVAVLRNLSLAGVEYAAAGCEGFLLAFFISWRGPPSLMCQRFAAFKTTAGTIAPRAAKRGHASFAPFSCGLSPFSK